MQWHNYVREFVSSQREIKSGAWRDSTPRLVQALVHAVYLTPGTLKGFANQGISIGIKVLRKTTTLYSDPVVPELVRAEVLTESILEGREVTKIQIPTKSLFTVCYPHSCVRNVSDLKLFLAIGDKRQKLHKVYETLIDLDFLLGGSRTFMVPMSRIKNSNEEIEYACVHSTAEVSLDLAIGMQSPVVLGISLRSIYPTVNILSRFPKDFIERVARLIDFSPVSRQETFTQVDRAKDIADIDVNIDKGLADRFYRRKKSQHHPNEADSTALAANKTTDPATTAANSLKAPDGTAMLTEIPHLDTDTLIKSNSPCATPLDYVCTKRSSRLFNAPPNGLGMLTTLQKNVNVIISTQAESLEFSKRLKQSYRFQNGNPYITIVSAFKAQRVDTLLSIFGLSQAFSPQDNALSHTVSYFTNFPTNISEASSSIKLSATLRSAPILMQQNSRLTLTHTDQHTNAILNLLMQMFPSLPMLSEMNIATLFPNLGDLSMADRSRLISGQLQAPESMPSEIDMDNVGDANIYVDQIVDDSKTDREREEREGLTQVEGMEYIFSAILDRLSDIITLVKGRDSSTQRLNFPYIGMHPYITAVDPTSGSFPISAEAFELLCELLDIRNNIFFQRTIVFVFYNSELEYPSLLASALQSDDSICYFPLPYNSNIATIDNISVILRLAGLYIAMLYKILHVTSIFSSFQVAGMHSNAFATFNDGYQDANSAFNSDFNDYQLFAEDENDSFRGSSDKESSLGVIITEQSNRNLEAHAEGNRGAKLSLISLLLKLREKEDGIFQQLQVSHNKSQCVSDEPIPRILPLDRMLNDLGYGDRATRKSSSRTIYISEVGDITAYKVPAVASVMQRYIRTVLLTSSDDIHYTQMYNLLSAYNQSVSSSSNMDEVPISVGERHSLGLLMIKGLMLIRSCASLSGVSLTTLHPIVIYSIPVPSVAHTPLFDYACSEGARAAILGLVAQMSTCIMRGSVADLIANNSKTYERLFGTPVWLAIVQCYCNGVLSWLYSYLSGTLYNHVPTLGSVTPRAKDNQPGSIYGATEIDLTLIPPVVSTPVNPQSRPQARNKEQPKTQLKMQTGPAIAETDSLSTSYSQPSSQMIRPFERLIKVLETIINQAIKEYLKASSVIPLVALLVQVETVPNEKVLHAPLNLMCLPSEDRCKLKLIVDLLKAENTSNTSSPVSSCWGGVQGLTAIKYIKDTSPVRKEGYTIKDLLSSRQFFIERKEEPKIHKGRSDKAPSHKKAKVAQEKKMEKFICWERMSFYRHLAGSYLETNALKDVQLQMIVGGVPTRDDKGSKALSLRNVVVFNSRFDTNIAATNTFLYTLRINRYVYTFNLYHLINPENSPWTQIKCHMCPAGDEYRWYTHMSIYTPAKAVAGHIGERHTQLGRPSGLVTKQSPLLVAGSTPNTPFNMGGNYISTHRGNYLADVVDHNLNPPTLGLRSQAVVLSDSSVTDDQHDISQTQKDLAPLDDRCIRPNMMELKTSSGAQSGHMSISTSGTDIHSIADPVGPVDNNGATLFPNTIHTDTDIDINTDTKEKIPNRPEADLNRSAKLTPVAARSTTKSVTKKSMAKNVRDSLIRGDANIVKQTVTEDDHMCFVPCSNPDQPNPKQSQSHFIYQQYHHSFIGIDAKSSSIMLRPEAALQPYIRPSVTSQLNSGSETLLTYIPAELVKKPENNPVTRAHHDGFQHEIRITSKKTFLFKPDQTPEPVPVQSVTIKKSTNDAVLLGVFGSNH